MSKRLTSIRLSDLTSSQLAWLCQANGETQAEIIARSIEIYYQMVRREADHEKDNETDLDV